MKDEFTSIKAIFDNAPIGMALTRKTGEVVNMNARCISMLGYSSLDDVKIHIKNLSTDLYVKPEQRENIISALSQGMLDEPFYVDYKRKDNTILHTRLFIKPYRSEDSNIDYLISTVEDLTQQRELEQNISNIKQQYKQLFDSSTEAVFIHQNDIFIDFNKRAKELFGFEDKSKQYMFTDISPEYQPDGQKSIDKGLHKIKKALKGEAQKFEWEFIDKKGKQIFAEVALNKIENGFFGNVLAIFRDITETKQKEMELIKAINKANDTTKMLENIVNTIPVRLFWKDCKGVYLGSNQLFAEDAGCNSPSELIGKTDYDLFDEKVAEAFRNDDNEVISKVKPKLNYEELQSGKNREMSWLNTSKVPLKNHTDEVYGVLGTYDDITQRKIVEEKLKTQEAMLSSIIDCLPFELFVTNLNSDLLFQNSFSKRIWGNYIGKNIGDGPASENGKRKWFENLEKIKANETLNYEDILQLKGKTYHAHKIVAPFRVGEEIKGVVSLSIDISEKVKLEKIIYQNASFLNSILSSIPIELWVIDSQDNIHLQSDFSINKWGDLRGKKTSDFNAPVKFSVDVNSLVKQVKKGNIVDTEYEVEYEGQKKYSRRILSPLLDQSNKYGYTSISFDITELKNTLKELQEHKENLELLVEERTQEINQLNEELQANNEELYTTNEMLLEERNRLEEALEELKQIQGQLIKQEKMASIGTLTAGIAHEINNPVNFISSGITGLEFMLEEMTQLIHRFIPECIEIENCPAKGNIDASEIREKITELLEELPLVMESIKNGVDRTTNIVKGLRTFTRLDSQKFEKANINQLIDSTLTILFNKYKGRIEIVKSYSDIEEFYCYPGKLGQAILNLLVNSIQAINDKGKIIITTSLNKGKDNIVLKIKDSGPGIPNKILNNIFDPFFTTKNVGEGTGLGLSIVHGIIEEHNGIIEVDSQEGIGTEFTIFLPLKKDAER